MERLGFLFKQGADDLDVALAGGKHRTQDKSRVGSSAWPPVNTFWRRSLSPDTTRPMPAQ